MPVDFTRYRPCHFGEIARFARQTQIHILRNTGHQREPSERDIIAKLFKRALNIQRQFTILNCTKLNPFERAGDRYIATLQTRIQIDGLCGQTVNQRPGKRGSCSDGRKSAASALSVALETEVAPLTINRTKLPRPAVDARSSSQPQRITFQTTGEQNIAIKNAVRERTREAELRFRDDNAAWCEFLSLIHI